MTITRHPITIEPEVRALAETLSEDREYVITRDLVAHEIVRQGGGDKPVTFYDASTGREVGLVHGTDTIRLGADDARRLREAVRDEQATAGLAPMIRSLNSAAVEGRPVADMLAAHAELAALEQVRERRDELVRQVAATGTTPYRIAKLLGVAESTIGRIIARGQDATR